MSQEPKTSPTGQQLWSLLPQVYRERDKDGDLAKFLDASGELLDRIYQTLLQRLEDTSPETCQDWLLPYFAQLLDVRLVSTDVDGQRQEVVRAVDWRQRKGTIACMCEITEEIGRLHQKVVIQEGHTRVATTTRVGMPLLSMQSLGEEALGDAAEPAPHMLHPGLPMGTVDFRKQSYAKEIDQEENTAVSHTNLFPNGEVTWQQAHRRAVPRVSNSYQDLSVRTVDMRTPDWRVGHHHHKRVLLHTPPPTGFFSPDQPEVAWTSIESVLKSPEHQEHVEAMLDEPDQSQLPVTVDHVDVREQVIQDDDGTITHRTTFTGRATEEKRGTDRVVPVIVGSIHLNANSVSKRKRIYRFENVVLGKGSSKVWPIPLTVGANPSNGEDSVTVENATLELQQVAAKRVVVDSTDTTSPVLSAVDCLLDRLEVAGGLARLEYGTVLGDAVCKALQASDCIFNGSVLAPSEQSTPTVPLRQGYVRYSRVPSSIHADVTGLVVHLDSLAYEKALFWNTTYGLPGCGVLHPATPDSIRFGAEAGGEMGAFHHRHHTLREVAVIEKLKQFLPVGMEAVLIPDLRWWTNPPTDESSS